MKTIELSKGMVALVCDEDFEWLNKFNWYASNESKGLKWYAIRRVTRNGKRVKIRMHREVVGLPTGLEDPRIVDHGDDDGLNNQRWNLTVLENNTDNMARSKNWRKKGGCYL